MLELEVVKAHLRVLGSEEDSYIQSLADAAIAQIENDTQRRILGANVSLKLAEFPAVIELPLTPVSSVDSITYIDLDGNQQTLTGYYLDDSRLKAVVKPLYGQAFPAVKPGYESITVNYTVGDFESMPTPIKQAALLLIGHWFANREAVVTGTITAELPMAYDALIQPYRVPF